MIKSIIRWKFVLPAVLLTVGLVVFFVMFFDPILERGLESAGAKFNKAKVDITGLKTKFAQGRLEIKHIAVSSHQDPMTNRFEAGPLVFQLDLSEVMTRRIVIPEAGLEGILFGTKRKTSGFIPVKKKAPKPDKKPSAASKLVDKYKDQFKLNLDGLKSQVKDKVKIDPKNLEITRQADALKEKADGLPAVWKNNVEVLKVDDRLKQIEIDLKTVKKTPLDGVQAITAIPASLKLLKKSQGDLDVLKNEIKNLEKVAKTDLANINQDVKNLNNAKKADIDFLLSKMNLDFADPHRLAQGLVGAGLLDRMEKTLKYIQLARKYLPSKAEKETLPQHPRAEGMDIEFPTPASPPRFWLKKAKLAGSLKDINFDGSIQSLSSDPPRVGKPVLFSLLGTKDKINFKLQAALDHVTDIKSDSFIIEAKNIQLSAMNIPGVLGQAIVGGSSRVEFSFKAVGEDAINGLIHIDAANLKLNMEKLLDAVGIKGTSSLEDKLKIEFVNKMARGIEGMESLKIDATLSGTWADPDMKFTTNLNSVLAGVIKSSVGDMVRDQRKEIEAQLNNILNMEQDKVREEIAKLDSRLKEAVSKYDGNIEEAIHQATGINLSPAKGAESGLPFKVPDLKSIFK